MNSTNHDTLAFQLPEGVYDAVRKKEYSDYQVPLSGTESHENQYIELLQPKSVSFIGNVAERAGDEGSQPNIYMELQQQENAYDIVREKAHEVRAGNEGSQPNIYMEIQQQENGYEVVREAAHEVSRAITNS